MEKVIFNTVSCNDYHIQEEVKAKFNENISQSTISRKLTKMKIARKRLSLISKERNTYERIKAHVAIEKNLELISTHEIKYKNE